MPIDCNCRMPKMYPRCVEPVQIICRPVPNAQSPDPTSWQARQRGLANLAPDEMDSQ